MYVDFGVIPFQREKIVLTVTRDPNLLHSYVYQGLHRLLPAAHSDTENTYMAPTCQHRCSDSFQPCPHHAVDLPVLACRSRLGSDSKGATLLRPRICLKRYPGARDHSCDQRLWLCFVSHSPYLAPQDAAQGQGGLMRPDGARTHVSPAVGYTSLPLTTTNRTGACCVIRMTWNWQAVPQDLTCPLKAEPTFPNPLC